MPKNELTLQFTIRGRVQGVYYRASLQREALRLGLRGYVLNQADGSVRAVGRGSAEALKALKQWCWEGPPLAIVKRVEVQETKTESEAFEGFEIRRESP